MALRCGSGGRHVSDPRSGREAVIAWATNDLYPTRIHMTNCRGRVSLCGFPISKVTSQRPSRLRICPDCAMAFVEVLFPVVGADLDSVEWFRQLPARKEFQ